MWLGMLKWYWTSTNGCLKMILDQYEIGYVAITLSIFDVEVIKGINCV